MLFMCVSRLQTKDRSSAMLAPTDGVGGDDAVGKYEAVGGAVGPFAAG